MLAATVRVTRDLDARRGGRPGRVRVRADGVGARRRPGAPGRLADDRRAAQRAQRARARARTLRTQAAAAARARAPRRRPDADGRPTRSPTTACGWSSPAATRRSRREAQVALTLRLVCGVATADIAHAFLVTEPTMAARLTRAKKKIAAARIPYVVPAADDLPDAARRGAHRRPPAVHDGPHRAVGRAPRARRPRRARARPGADAARAAAGASARSAGLLALLLLHDARRATRTDATDACCASRSRTARAGTATLIAEADALIVGARCDAGPPGRFTLQAAIAGAARRRRRATPRPTGRRSSSLYDVLLGVWPSPVVALNRAVARRRWCDGPAAALAEVERSRRRRLDALPLPAGDEGRPPAPPRPPRGGRRPPTAKRSASPTTPPSARSSRRASPSAGAAH